MEQSKNLLQACGSFSSRGEAMGRWIDAQQRDGGVVSGGQGGERSKSSSHTHRRRWGGEGKACNAINPFPFAVGPLCPPLTFVSLEIAMRPDVEAMKADIEQSVALLRRRL